VSAADEVGGTDTAQGVGDQVLDPEAAPAATADPGSGPADGDTTDTTDTADDAVLEGDLVEMVEVAEKIAAERDEYLDMARRVQAEFENYKRRVEQQRVEQRERAAEHLVSELLPVLDAGEAAVAQGMSDVAAIHAQLLSTLEKLGLSAVVEVEVDFDPNVHEAVLHEEGDGDPVVAEVLRTGYLWNSRVLRPAMVKVRG
jgi:molecular chaperone GrpE